MSALSEEIRNTTAEGMERVAAIEKAVACPICGNDVLLHSSHTGRDGKRWHPKCFKAQAKIEEYYRKWQACLDRLKSL